MLALRGTVRQSEIQGHIWLHSGFEASLVYTGLCLTQEQEAKGGGLFPLLGEQDFVRWRLQLIKCGAGTSPALLWLPSYRCPPVLVWSPLYQSDML